MSKKKWYASGLRFECQRCNGCCRGEPGYVWVTHTEISRMAEHLSMPIEEFAALYVREVHMRFSLRELVNGDCVLWGGERACLVYPVRPAQCVAFPFWRANLSSKEVWAQTARRCPGISCGRLFSLDEIEKRLKKEID